MNSTSHEIVVLVGAGPGLGTAVARRLGGDRATVVLLARSPTNLEALAAELAEAGVDAYGIPADAGDETSLRAAFAQVRERFGDPGILVYNASRYVEGLPTSVDPADLVDGFRTGVAGALVAAQEVAPAMRRDGRGTLLLTGNAFATKPFARASAVGVAKAGLRNLAGSLADELGPDGVHVAVVTVAGVIGEGRFAPDALAEEYARLHAQPPEDWEHEVVVR
jgi:NAD(P)-dependent dehydrogenase (short-subunit alcohol dehydrogenase family)